MKLSIPRVSKFILGAFIISSPLVASAQSVTNVTSLFTYALNILNGYVIPVIFAVAFVMFLFGVYRYFIGSQGEAEKLQDGRKFVMWSILGFVVMFSIWGIINLFINSLGFDTTSRPALPTFNYTTGGTTGTVGGINGLSSLLGSLFGGGNSNNVLPGSVVNNGTLIPGSTVTSGGVSYPVTSANTVQAVNGQCPSNFTLSGSTCTQNSSGGGTPAANGSVAAGGACLNNAQCSGETVCNTGTGTCSADGPTVYSCADDSTPTNGKCADGTTPTNVNGDAPAAGANGSACTNNSQCDGNGGNSVCNTVTGTCAVDGANVFSCDDDSTPNANGQCADGSTPSNADGSKNAVANGSVQIGGSCASNPNACAGDNTTCNDAGVCEADDGSGNTAPGSVGAGGSCADSPNVCANGTTCGDNGLCNAVAGNGTVGAGGSCAGNENACVDGYTCDDNDTCSADASVDNSNTTVSCNDGTTQDADTGCSDDCGNQGSTNTCDNSDSSDSGDDSGS